MERCLSTIHLTLKVPLAEYMMTRSRKATLEKVLASSFEGCVIFRRLPLLKIDQLFLIRYFIVGCYGQQDHMQRGYAFVLDNDPSLQCLITKQSKSEGVFDKIVKKHSPLQIKIQPFLIIFDR